MKIHILFLLALSFTLVVSLSRKDKTNKKKKAQSNMADVFKVFIRIDGGSSGNQEYEAQCRKQDIMDQKNAKVLGLYFYGLTQVNDDIAKILARDGDALYLPYRIASPDWKATQTGKTSRDYVETTVMIEGKSHTFKLKVDYNTFSTNDVTYKELQDIAQVLNVRCQYAKNNVQNTINDLNNLATKYKQNMDSLESSKSGIEGLNKEVQTLNTGKQKLLNENEILKSQSVSLDEQITAALKTLSDLRQQQENITNQSIKNNNDIDSKTQQIQILQTQIDQGSTSSTKFQTDATTANTNYTTLSGQFKNSVPELGAPQIVASADQLLRTGNVSDRLKLIPENKQLKIKRKRIIK